MQPIRILHVVGTMDFGGVETLLMTIYRKIDRTKIQFDFLCHNTVDCKFSDEIASLGGKMFMVKGPRHGGMLKYQKALLEFFKSHPQYQIVHCHKSDLNGLILRQAKKAGVKHRISHSHIADCTHPFPMNLVVKYSRSQNLKAMTGCFACSVDAGRYLFGNQKFTVLPNAIDVDRFTFDSEKRKQCRKELGISDDIRLIGHVGRFAEQKNHSFLVDVFAQYNKIVPNSRLLLLGGGDLEEPIRKKVRDLSLESVVIFGGLHSDLSGYYCAMDAFLFPSNFEGLGIVAVEAQCAGLPVLASENVPKEAKVIDSMQFMSLQISALDWAKKINTMLQTELDRKAQKVQIEKSMFNIGTMAAFLQKYYLELG